MVNGVLNRTLVESARSGRKPRYWPVSMAGLKNYIEVFWCRIFRGSQVDPLAGRLNTLIFQWARIEARVWLHLDATLKINCQRSCQRSESC